jgi:indole-3-glycerol phosphate synthase/phosphoribosylanthranilate isomerase
LPPTCELWQAISVTDHIAEFSPFANKIVLDNQQGGSGKTFNWQLLNSTGVALNRAILAGGINTENIHDAIRCYTQYQMLGLDINSGVEVSPGIKSSTLIEQIFSKIRQY